jgi:hypothetical protein
MGEILRMASHLANMYLPFCVHCICSLSTENLAHIM